MSNPVKLFPFNLVRKLKLTSISSELPGGAVPSTISSEVFGADGNLRTPVPFKIPCKDSNISSLGESVGTTTVVSWSACARTGANTSNASAANAQDPSSRARTDRPSVGFKPIIPPALDLQPEQARDAAKPRKAHVPNGTARRK